MTDYMILFPADREDDWDLATVAERQEVYATDEEFVRLLGERGGRVTGGAELASASRAHVLRRSAGGGAVVTDGPFAESVEQLSGFYLVSTDDEAGLLEAAQVLVRSHPAVEVRPVVGSEDDS
ncbi:YciI family protein [Nocardioides sp.]|uniref:YciI family protein n=1 Tax=Nocardioides sp. TaxID=35761 RepID=UPI002716589A|nr:YciI family protein [Nocardioides sp.]MDO9455635.1 YciI family protein [Nocardioides sp.]